MGRQVKDKTVQAGRRETIISLTNWGSNMESLVQETLENKSEYAWKKRTQDSTKNRSSPSHKCYSREDVEREAMESEKVGYWHNDAE